METKIDPKIFEHLEEALTLLDAGGASIRKNRDITYWLKKIVFTYSYMMAPLFEILDIFHQERQNIIQSLAFHLSIIWGIFVGGIMILQWYKSMDIFIQAMVRVREKQLLIGEIDGKILETVSKELKMKKNLIVIFVWCLVGVIVGGLTGWTFSFSLGTSKMEFNEAIAKKYPLPFPLWFPVNYAKSKTIYFLVGIFTACLYLLLGTCTIGIMSLFYSFTTFGTIHFMILNYFLKTMHERTVQKLEGVVNTFKSEKYNKIMKEELRKCVIYLQEILSYCDLIENKYSTILLIETICSCVAITGTLSLVVLTPKNDPKYISYFMIFAACLEQTFLFCFFGDRLTQEAGNVRESLYFNNWIDVNKSFKKSMLIVSIRMSKPVTITMGKVSPVQLTTFIQIMRAAYSFMALLQNSNAAVKG